MRDDEYNREVDALNIKSFNMKADNKAIASIGFDSRSGAYKQYIYMKYEDIDTALTRGCLSIDANVLFTDCSNEELNRLHKKIKKHKILGITDRLLNCEIRSLS